MRFVWKVLGTLGCVLVLTVLFVELAALPRIERRLVADVQDGLRTANELAVGLVDAALGEDGSFDAARLEGRWRRLPDRRLTVVAPDGEVRFDTHEDLALMENHGRRPEIVRLGEVVERRSPTLGIEMIYHALPVDRGGQRLAIVRLALERAAVDRRIADLSSTVRWTVLLGGAIGLALAAAIASRIARPLTEMTSSVDTIGRGVGDRLPERGRDEIAQLGAAINRMADELEGRLARSERDQFEKDAILAGMTDGVVAVDGDQNVVLVNAAAREMLEATTEDPRGRPIWEVTRVPEVVETVGACLADSRHVAAEVLLPADDASRVLQLLAAPLATRSAGQWGCVLVLHDLTELRRLEGIRRDFVANVSHELKTPLTSMRGYLETVLDDPDMPADTRRSFLERAERMTQRLAAIVGDLLTLARVESEDGQARITLVDLSALARENADELSASAEARLVEIAVQAERPVVVEGDRQMLGTAVRNLLDNAIKYSPENGRVRVATGLADDAAWLSVADQGPGIPLSEHERVFERFYRVDKNRSRQLGGTGLGLSIVRNVMVAHGGQVTLDSEPGRGSEFRLTVPRHSE